MPHAARTPPHLATLILLSALSVLSLNMFLPSLANIAADFDADYAVVSLAVAGFLGATAVVHLVSGPLADRWGRRPVILVSLSIFTAASVACSITADVWSFLAFRVLQSAVATGAALSLAIVRDTTSTQDAASRIGYMSMVMALAPMLGPVLGGVLDVAFGWRATFWFYAAAGAGMMALVYVDLGETKPESAGSAGAEPDTFITVLRAPAFWAYALCTMFSTGMFFIFLAGAPLVAATNFGVEPAGLGVFIGSITAGFMVGNFLAGRFASRFALSTMMIAGRLVAAFGLLLGLFLLIFGEAAPLRYFGCIVVAGLGNGITMPSSNTGAISVRPTLAGSASGLNAAINVGGGALLTSLTGVALSAAPAPALLLVLMLGSVAAGLLAALWARSHERRGVLA